MRSGLNWIITNGGHWWWQHSIFICW